MAQRPADDVLRGVATLIKLLGAATTAALPILLPDRLVPDQLEATRAGASLIAALGFLLAISYGDAVVRRRRLLVIGAIVAALVVVALNHAFVVAVPDGDEEAQVLVGFAHTDTGLEKLRLAGKVDASRREQLASLGRDQVVPLWGWTFYAVAGVYTLALWTLLLTGTAALVATGAEGAPSQEIRVER